MGFVGVEIQTPVSKRRHSGFQNAALMQTAEQLHHLAAS